VDKAKNRKTVKWLVLLAVGMFGFAFALVPLYDLFCQVTGIRGTGPEAEPTSQEVDSTRLVLVEFDGIVNSNLPWEFEPTKRRLEVTPGEVASVAYRVTNLANEEVTGQAIPSVIPWFGAEYLKKMACFCFDNQTLKAGETKEMPLRFYVSKDIPKDINTLRLSYSFFNTNTK
jgi:cytochrome c oxidase assembly protein subunit 11